MLAIRILTGAQAGQIFPLGGGQHRLGRGQNCEIKINSNSVSKEHASIMLAGDKLILTDMNSRNGTFVNGVRIQNQRIGTGDKIGLHDMLLDVVSVPDEVGADRPMMPQGNVYQVPPPKWAGNAALNYQSQGQHQNQNQSLSQITSFPGHQPGSLASEMPQMGSVPQPQMSAHSLNAVFNNFKIYVDNVAMPGIYKIVQSMPYRFSLLALVTIYVIIVTALSTIPVVNTTKQNIKQESLRRAKTIARNMASMNRQGVIEDNDAKMSVRQAELEEGVTTAVLIRARDGTIMAPASKRGDFVNKPFINKARSRDNEKSEVGEFIDDSTLGVSIPITVYSPENGDQSVVAYAIVLYDMGALAINATQTFSLFVQTLAIALLVGFVLYFFLFKIVEHPIDALNAQLDDALREGRDDIETDYQFLPLERLKGNINSALSRIDHSGGNGQAKYVADRDSEARNLVNVSPCAAIAINGIDERIICSNTTFDRLIGLGVTLSGQPVTAIPDRSMQGQLADLIPQMRAQVAVIANGQIPFSGQMFEISGQAVMEGESPAYFLVFIQKVEPNG